MTYSQMLKTLESTGLSAEQLAPALGVSNMTVRRWKTDRAAKTVSRAHERLLMEAVYQFIIEGKLDPESPPVQSILASARPLSIPAAMKGMGINLQDLDGESGQQDKLVEILGRIGLAETHRNEVDSSQAKIKGFKKMGQDWKRMLTVLVRIIRSERFSLTEKLVAYGALFYLICPFDLIPDNIPIFGFMDDFAVLAIAMSFYGPRIKKFNLGMSSGVEE